MAHSSLPAALPHSHPRDGSNPLLDFPSSLHENDAVSPWTANHRAFRAHVRRFVREHLTPAVVDEAEANGRASRELLRSSYSAGLYALHAPTHLGGTPPSGAALPSARRPHDHLYDVVLLQELMRCGAMGLVTELIGSFGTTLPLLQTFARGELRERLLRPMVQAETMICFAVTEPPMQKPTAAASATNADAAASTVTTAVSSSSSGGVSLSAAASPSSPPPPPPAAPSRRRRGPPGLRTTATLSSDGSSYVVSGEKMYISFAARADYILTAVQLRKEGDSDEDVQPSLSLLLIPASAPGVRIDLLPLVGWCSTSTTRIRLDGVRVPAEALLVDGGAGDNGGRVAATLARLMRDNINRERFVTATMAAAAARCCLDDALAFARNKALPRGRRLADSPPVREQLVVMGARVAAAEALVLQCALQLSAARPSDPDAAATHRRALAQQVALLKYACSDALSFCAATAGSILGAAALTRGGSGPGARIERLKRDAPVNAAAGGGEHTLLEFVARQAKL